MTKNFVFDLVDVITGCKIISEKYYFLTKHYCPKDQNSLFKKQCIKGGETRSLTYQLSWIQNRPGMFTVKNFRVVYVKYMYYLTKIRDRNLEVNLLKVRKNNKHLKRRVP